MAPSAQAVYTRYIVVAEPGHRVVVVLYIPSELPHGPKCHYSLGDSESRAHDRAKRTPFPAFIKPCLAKLHGAPPEGDAWTHEEKIDGYRLEAHLRSERATLYTRKGFDWTHKFSTIARALQTVTAEAAVFDGEVAVF
ncbi:MAG: putative ATP-dependent ligase protein [Gammaproteobacteria bacterium]|nr:putative ATP-dependent ligase protein [Gammaproteobacteria bacterium]